MLAWRRPVMIEVGCADLLHGLTTIAEQGRSDGGISVYIPSKISP